MKRVGIGLPFFVGAGVGCFEGRFGCVERRTSRAAEPPTRPTLAPACALSVETDAADSAARSRIRADHWRGVASLTVLTEITLLGGEAHRVEGEAKDVEQAILSAARGSIMQFAWFTDAQTAEPVGVNPEHVMMLRAVGATGQAAGPDPSS